MRSLTNGQPVWITIGIITAPHGVRGAVRVLPTTDFPDRFHGLKRVYLTQGDDRSPHDVRDVREGPKGQMLLSLSGTTTRDEAETYRGAEIQVPRSEVVPLPPGHYYVFQLVGCEVVTTDGTHVGTLRDVHMTGANDVYVILGSDGKEILIPAIKPVVVQINLDLRQIVIDPIPGLLD